MKYLKNEKTGEVFGYDETEQQLLIDVDIENGLTDVTDSWPPAPPVLPNTIAFIAAVKISMGGIVAAANIPHSPLFFVAINQWDWIDAHALLVDAKTTGAINDAQYADIKAAAIEFDIPITL